MNALKEHIMQCWLLKIFHGVFQYLRDTSLTLQLPLALKIIFAREDIIALKNRLKEKQCFVLQEHIATFLGLVNLLIVQFALLATTVQTKQWILSFALSATIAPLD
jgi:hypothetical protein